MNSTPFTIPREKYVTLKVVGKSKVITIYLDGVSVSSVILGAFVANAYSGFTVGSNPTDTMNANFARFELNQGSTRICYNFLEGAGTTITDSCGSNNSTLTDSSPLDFWSTDYVPIDGTGNAIRYHSDDVKQKRKVFKNGGDDVVDVGRPTALINLLAPTNAYLVECVANPSNVSTFQALVSIATTTVSERQIHLRITSSGGLEGRIGGGNSISQFAGMITAGTYIKAGIKSFGSTFRLYLNNVESGTLGNNGTTLNAVTPIAIGAYATGSDNFEGTIARVRFMDSVGNIVDEIDFGDSNQWTGGLTGQTLKGNPFTITNAAPVEMYVDDLVPVNKLS
jgi:hypothetical protein